MQNAFFMKKWIHYMGGKRSALVRVLWARPPHDEFIFHEDKNYFCIDIKIDENFPVVDEVSCLEDKIWTISSVFCET